WQTGLAGLLALIALAAALWGKGLVGGFVLLGALLLSAALALPGALAMALALGERLSKGVIAQWFWADTRQQLPGLSLALMALLLALSANIGVGTMVSSFRLAFTAWLDQRLPSELYVTGRTEDEARRLAEWLSPRTEALLPIWKIDGPLLGRPGEVYGVADHRTYPDNWPMIRGDASVWKSLARGEGVIVNEQLWRRAALHLGDPVTLPGGATRPLIGVYADYGNTKGQAILGIADLLALYPGIDRRRYAIRTDPANVPALRSAIEDDFGLPADNMISQQEVKQVSLMVFERTFAVTAALNVLTMGVAGFAMFMSLLTLSTMRLPQLAPVWALGLTRGRLARLELLRAVLLATLPAGSLPEAVADESRSGAFLSAEGLAFAAPQTVEELTRIGAPGLPPLATAPGMAPGLLLVDIGTAQRLLRAGGEISRLLLAPEQPLRQRPLDEIAPGLIRQSPAEQADMGALTGSFHLNLTAFGFLSFAVGLFIVHSAIGLAFEQRRPIFRTLRALGLPLRTLVGLLAAEIMGFALVAGITGIALGYVIAAGLLPNVAATLRGLYGATVSGSLSLRPEWALAGLGMALAGAAAAAAQSLWRLARMPVLAPAQPRAWTRASARSLGWQTGLAGWH
ncbi:ABC transporter permease, partial [Rhodovulum sulfidophilum]|uniref:ABC transporter permease n=1 Tax=Rhodovulum sulfidophilum TaxID=35806 RepID=UPI000966CFFD